MSDTPRTDANAITRRTLNGEFLEEVVRANFARQLERELAQAYERAAQVCEHDAYAITFQTMGQYRKGLAAAIRALIPNSGTTEPKEGGKLTGWHFEPTDRGIAVYAPCGSAYHATPDDDENIASYVLWKLAAAIRALKPK